MTIIGDTSKLFEGFNTACDAVKSTLGAEGKLALLESEVFPGQPRVTKDGVSVARHLSESDPIKLQGLLLAKQSAVRTLVEVGDNTTTTLVLAQAMANSVSPAEFNKKVERGFETAYNETQEWLDKLAKAPDEETIKSVATVAANNDENIGSIVSEAYLKAKEVGGYVDFQDNPNSLEVKLKITEGLSLDRGMFSPACVNDQQRAVFDSSLNDRPTVVIPYIGWESYKNAVIQNFINNNYLKYNIVLILEKVGDTPAWEDKCRTVANLKGSLVVIEAPMRSEEEREQILKDIAVYTGGEVFIQGVSDKVVFGQVSKVKSDQNKTYFSYKEVGQEDRLKETVENINTALKEDITESAKKFLEYRKKLLSGVSILIDVGGLTDVERGEVYDRVDDALRAVQSVEDGWVPGGGSTFAYIHSKLNREFDNKDVQKGYNAFKEAILSPFKQICINSRRNNFEEYLKPSFETFGMGYNGSKDEVSNLIEDRILDSKKGLSSALKNAKSTAVMMLNINVISLVSMKDQVLDIQ